MSKIREEVVSMAEEMVYTRRDTFGRVYFDFCETGDQHMLAPGVPPEGRRQCRTFLEDLVPELAFQKRGTISIIVQFKPDDEG